MTTLALWYPGDGAVLTSLEVLGMIAILVTLTWAAEQFLARRRAALRHALWTAALVGVLLTPSVALIGRWLPWHITVLPPEGSAVAPSPERPPSPAPARADAHLPTGKDEQPHSLPPSGTREEVPAPSDPAVLLPVHETQTLDSGRPPSQGASEAAPAAANQSPAPPANFLHGLATLAILVWGLGAVYLSVRLLHGWLRVRRFWCRLRPLDGKRWSAELAQVAQMLSAERLPVICVSPDVRSPLAAGLFFPRVILPESLPERSTSHQLRDVLLHECAHVLRRDSWVRLLQRLAGVLFWVHPLVHLLNRRLDHAREEVCDNHVLAHADAAEYAETLLTVSQICYPTPRLEGYLTMIPYRHNLERRVAGLLETRRDTATRLPTIQRAAVLTVLVVLLGAIASVGLHSAAAQEKPAAAASPAPEVAKKQTPTAAVDKPGEPVVPLSGTILAEDDSPAAGATVWAARFTSSPLVRRETVADAQGRYTLDLDPGSWYVWARRGTQGGQGAEGRGATANIVAGKPTEAVTIRLEERGKFYGRLLEAETGKPISGGKLFLDAGLVLTTDADGRFEVGGLSREGHEAFVVAPGRRRMRVLFNTTARADTGLDVPVPRGAKIVGRVTDLDGKPIAGAYVGHSTSGSYFSTNGLYTACDAEGRFVYDGCTPDQATRLNAGAPGYIEDDREGIIGSPDGKPLELDFRLRPKLADLKPGIPPVQRPPEDETRRIVSGVVRGPDKKPVEGVRVRWGFQPFSDAIEAQTDAEGRFRLTVPAKENLLAVLPRDFTPQFPRVAANGDQTVEITLQEGHTTRGCVLDENDRAIKNVLVMTVIRSPEPRIANPYWLTEAAVHTDAEGKFALKGVPDGARFDLTKPGMSEIRNRELTLDGADNTLNVRLYYGGAINGRVVDQDGKPIRSFRVLVNFPREKKPGDVSGGFFAGYTGIGVRFTSDDGGFVLTGVGAGSVNRITAIADGYGQAVIDRVTAVALNHLADAKPVTLRVGAPVALRVRAVTAGGKPIAGARVTLIDGDPGLDGKIDWGYPRWEDTVRGRTDADGWADFPALSFGDATLLVEAPGYARHKEGWRDGKKELTVTLPAEAVLAGEVHDAAGAPVKDVSVTLDSGGDHIYVSVGPDAKGRFRIAELPAGPWNVTIRDADGLTTLYKTEATLKAGEVKELNIEVKKGPLRPAESLAR
jgi:beta-lactamase regulating signal transducer with metallopeptidase domain